MKSPRSKSILVVEDDPITSFIVSELSDVAEVDVHLVNTASECVKTVSKTPTAHSVILMDINLPDYNGNEVARIIRGMPEDPPRGVKIYAHSSDNEWARKDLWSDAGFDGFIPKPITIEVLQRLYREQAA